MRIKIFSNIGIVTKITFVQYAEMRIVCKTLKLHVKITCRLDNKSLRLGRQTRKKERWKAFRETGTRPGKAKSMYKEYRL